MVNEEIIGGLLSALTRGQSLESAMMTFYNAGYSKEDIEESAKEVYNQVGPQTMGIKTSLQETLNDIAIKAGVPPTSTKVENPSPNVPEKIVLQLPVDKKPVGVLNTPTKEEIKPQQTISSPAQQNVSYPSSFQIKNQIEEAIKDLKPVNMPSRIEIIHKDETRPQIVQHVSGYSESTKSVNKAVTYILIVILLLLIVALGAVFLFKDDLIKLFNNLGIA